MEQDTVYSPYTHIIQHWCTITPLLHQLNNAIKRDFIPALVKSHSLMEDRTELAFPSRLSEMEISNPEELAAMEKQSRSPPDLCPHCHIPLTVSHILLDCPHLLNARSASFPHLPASPPGPYLSGLLTESSHFSIDSLITFLLLPLALISLIFLLNPPISP